MAGSGRAEAAGPAGAGAGTPDVGDRGAAKGREREALLHLVLHPRRREHLRAAPLRVTYTNCEPAALAGACLQAGGRLHKRVQDSADATRASPDSHGATLCAGLGAPPGQQRAGQGSRRRGPGWGAGVGDGDRTADTTSHRLSVPCTSTALSVQMSHQLRIALSSAQ